MFMRYRGVMVWIGVVVTASAASRVEGAAWWEFQDPESGIVCSLVHAANADLVVLQSSGQIMVASPPNTILPDITVDEYFNVYYVEEFVGSIAFAEDGNGDRALFWMTITGKLVEVGDFDVVPAASDLSPDDVSGAGCDVCARYSSLSGCDGEGDDDDDDSVASSLA
ncbi:MAG: hypothetical protein GY842_21030, partial [bacterium]|nr:hypothetical protein [bacterium]